MNYFQLKRLNFEIKAIVPTISTERILNLLNEMLKYFKFVCSYSSRRLPKVFFKIILMRFY